MIRWHSVWIVAVTAAVTALIRIIPFIIFGGRRKTPRFVLYLGRVLPYAVMAMLVVFCFKGVSVLTWPHGLPELIAGAAVVLLHLWKRNTLLSITCGTVIYMLLVQLIFI